jgi:formylglycine-generating enzyme required for sulfatase activity
VIRAPHAKELAGQRTQARIALTSDMRQRKFQAVQFRQRFGGSQSTIFSWSGFPAGNRLSVETHEVVNANPRHTRSNQSRNAHFRCAPNDWPRAICSRKNRLPLLAALLGNLLIVYSVFAGEIRVANPSTEEQSRRLFENASREQPWQNSLGMKFVQVSGTQVLFSIWDTRVEDFRAFVDTAGYDATGGMWSLGQDGWKQLGATWKEPGFDQGATDPVVGLNWDDARAFCAWLTEREHRSGVLPEGMHYRLPTDQEWSVAVGLDTEPGNTPEEKDSKIKLYPWGTEWPPPPGAGNYCGVDKRIGNESEGLIVIEGYNDGYSRTSPVGSFTANKYGLYDMGGDVWQWCEDWYNSRKDFRILRGASWYDHDPERILASYRRLHTPDRRGADVGFRCVVAGESSR